ncbi:hypothetical protein [Geoglobus ahangari]
MLDLLRRARTPERLAELENSLERLFLKYLSALRHADHEELFIRRRISRTSYSKTLSKLRP